MTAVPAAVLARYAGFEDATATPFGTGLINDTFRLDAGERCCVLQRLHPVFSPKVHIDIDAVTKHLAAKGLATPRLIPARDGSLWVEHPGEGRTEVWRAQTFVADAVTHDRAGTPAVACEAGVLVGRFHAALADLNHTYAAVRAGVHDTAKHLDTLEHALDAHPTHRLRDAVAPMAAEILRAGRALPDLSAQRKRHAHGDLKLSNLLFDAAGRGLCLVDLDTVGEMILAFELGDALRSWCNPAGEDLADCAIDTTLFEAALQGYARTARASVTADERDALVDGLATICTELAARFAADALHERYFGWNAAKFPGRGEHNLLRARGQWSLAKSVHAAEAGLRRTVRAALS